MMMTRNTVSVELAGLGLGESMKNNSPVTIEEKKKWLRRVSWAWEELQDLYEEKEENYHRATAKTASYSAVVVAGSKNVHKYDRLTLSQIEARIVRKEKQLERLRRETLAAINSIRDKTQRDVLKEIYVNCRTIPETAARLGYGERQTQRHHKRAVENIRITRSMIEKNTEKSAARIAQ